MFSKLSVVLCFAFSASVVAQSSLSVVCIAGQCLQGFSNATIGAKLSASGISTTLFLLPGQYTSTTNPALLHNLLTSSSATITSSPGFNVTSLSSLPLNIDLEPGLAIYSLPRYSGQSAFSQLPTSPVLNSSTPLPARSLVLSENVWAAVTSSSNDRFIIWDAVPDISQLPTGFSTSLSLLNVQSSACSPPCSGNGVCSASGTCTCPTGFTGSSCEACAEGFFGPTCQPCPTGCGSCDQGISGSGRCLTPNVINAPSTCDCLNGECGANGQCTCNPGWTTSSNGTACAQCAPGFFLTSTGDCQVCQLGCSQCSDGTGECVSCKQGFTQNANDKTKCDPLPSSTSSGTVCPDGSFSAGAQCSPCSPSCRTCTGPSSNQCILCAQGTYLFNSNCISADTNGVCQGTNGMIADNNKNECDTCGAKCTSCKIPNFSVASTVDQLQCTGCLPGFVLSGGKCIDSCPSGTFLSPQDNLTCTACSSSCGTCAGSADFCLTCASGQLASSGQCVSACPSNTFSSSGSCLKCHPDCATCSGPSFNQCSSCPSELPVLTNGRCLPTCAKTQFFDKTTSSCQACDSSCSSCSGSGSSSCLACSSTTQVLRAGSCVSANCNGSSSVIPGLGVCLSEMVEVPSTSGTGTAGPLPSITGLSDPTIVPVRRTLSWWEILLMALGCAFIFLVIVMLWRRRARKQRAKRTAMFASAKRLDSPHGWRWRLAKFGERLFGSRAANRLQKGQEVLPVASNHHDRFSASRLKPLSITSYGQDIKLKKMGNNESRSSSTKEEDDDVANYIDAYDYDRSAPSRTSRVLSTVHGEGRHRHYGQRSQQRRLDRDSLYSEITGNQRHTPEPRQPLKREPSGASRFTKSSVSTASKTRQPAKEGVLVDIAGNERALPSLPLQMASNTGSSTSSTPTEAQAYMMAVRPGFWVDRSFMPIPVHLVPNTTGGQGSYWLTPVPHGAVPQPQPQSPLDTIVLQPMNTGASSSRNPFRQEIY
ncbi:insulin-like growth factor binding protein [Gymnopilus junonius]|uniref:Insulin-like growth factor binding protein n=1 Tax=Gymnopilus junonius TaxID=109634 RepID=A0A9P5NJI5_GYMJU|nr:insulin-like growth factor binding protein [Gymnopilus junonius]